jgi:cytochrome c-type biogenesis protein CcmH
MSKTKLIILILFFSFSVFAEVDEQDYYAFIKKVKCVTCQNQSVADSYAPMALIMRKEIYQQFDQGKSQLEIRALLAERYGESIFFAPEVKSKHFIIWFMPVLILILGAFGLKRLLN